MARIVWPSDRRQAGKTYDPATIHATEKVAALMAQGNTRHEAVDALPLRQRKALEKHQLI